ncbi:MAG: hypothetical protein ACTHN0_06860 [Aquihabitans sp.]
MSRIYLASSWRNYQQTEVLFKLRTEGHQVYDFRNPHDDWTTLNPGDSSGGFRWSDIDPEWADWSPWSFRQALDTHRAAEGFGSDFNAMEAADVGVLLLPCGRSAHLEAGYFAGHPNKSLHILIPELPEPELMYLMADGIHLTVDELLGALRCPTSPPTPPTRASATDPTTTRSRRTTPIWCSAKPNEPRASNAPSDAPTSTRPAGSSPG